jgi:DNA polymerase III beta subunit, N-terminal domain
VVSAYRDACLLLRVREVSLSFTAKTQDLAALTAKVAQGLPSHPAQPVYAGFLMKTDLDAGNVSILASDGEMMQEVAGACDAESWGKCIVPGRLLNDISRYFAGDEVHFEHIGSELKITSGRSEFSLPARDADEYPVWKEPAPAFLQVDAAELAAGFRKVAPATGDNPVVLSAICMEPEEDALSLVTTDHSRMAVVQLPFTPVNFWGRFPAALLPVRAAERFARNLEGIAGIGWDEDMMLIQYAAPPFSGGRMIARLFQPPYLPWRKVLKLEPEGPGIACDTKELTRATRMAQLAAGPDNRISWTFGHHEVAVRAEREGRACTEYVPCMYEGTSQVFLLGAQHALDGLAGCGDTTQMTFTEPPAPLFLTSGNLKYMLKPRREL